MRSTPKANGGNVQPWAPHYSANSTRADSESSSLAYESLSANLAASRSPFIQTVIDISAVVAAFLFALATGIGIAFAFFVLLFVRL